MTNGKCEFNSDLSYPRLRKYGKRFSTIAINARNVTQHSRGDTASITNGIAKDKHVNLVNLQLTVAVARSKELYDFRE